MRARSRAEGLDLGGAHLVESDLPAAVPRPAAGRGRGVVLTANSAVPRAGDDPARLNGALIRLVDVAGASGVPRGAAVAAGQHGGRAGPRWPPSAVGSRRRSASGARLGDPALPAVHGVLASPRGLLRPAARRTQPHRRPALAVPPPVPQGNGVDRREAGPHARAGPDDQAAGVHRRRGCRGGLRGGGEPPELAGRTLDVGGPEVLTWDDVAAIFSRLLGRRVRAVAAPVGVFAVAATLLRPVAPVPSRTMALNRFLGTADAPWPAGGGMVDPAAMTTVEALLEAKLALPEALPTVA